MQGNRGRVVFVSLFLWLANFFPAWAKESSGKMPTKKDKDPDYWSCLARLRLERLEGYFEMEDTTDGFHNSEVAVGAECAYQYKRLRVFGGLEYALGDLTFHHEDTVLSVDLYTLQQSWKGWAGLGVAVTKKLDLSFHLGYRWLPETDIDITELLYEYSSFYDWDLSNISRKHIDVAGSAGVWEAGVKAAYRPVKPIAFALGVMWQRYTVEVDAVLDEYAQERLRIFGTYLEKNIALDSEADIVLFVPEVTICPFGRVCGTFSVPITVMDSDRWIRGASYTISVPLF